MAKNNVSQKNNQFENFSEKCQCAERMGVTKPFSQYIKNGARYLNKFFFPEKYSLSSTCWVTFKFLSNNPSL